MKISYYEDIMKIS